MMAVLSTAPDTMKFPSRVQQMSYTSPTCPLKDRFNGETKIQKNDMQEGQVLCTSVS